MANPPVDDNGLERLSGQSGFMLLPTAQSAEGLDVAIIGVPLDHGTSWRSGTQFGPNEIRSYSAMIRPYNIQMGAAPFDSLKCADLGNMAVNNINLNEDIKDISKGYDFILKHDVVPVTMGGDHTLTLPILRAIAKKHGPVGLVYVDAHADVSKQICGEREAQGTVLRLAYEEGLLDPSRVWQVGLRGTGLGAEDFDDPLEWGFKMILAQGIWHKSLTPLAEEIRKDLGAGPVYISFDIDSLDPAYAPGTGTPEIGGLTTPQAIELIRGLRGLEIVGCDMVEVSPPYDTTGNTALAAANLLFEMLSILPKVAYR